MWRPSLLLVLLLVLALLYSSFGRVEQQRQEQQQEQQQALEELRRCSEDALPDTELAWADRGAAETLGFVTPWNGKGYEVAEQHAARFTFISPVWFQIRRNDEKRQMELTGGHDHDHGWIERVRAASRKGAESCAADGEHGGRSGGSPGGSTGGDGGVKIVPRVLWEMDKIMQSNMVARLAMLISQEIKRRGYDGVLLEIPLDPGAEIVGSFVQSLRSLLPEDATIIVAIPTFQSPYRGGPQELQVTPATLAALEKDGVDRFLAMCYDAVMEGGRTNSPLAFVQATVDALAGRESKVRAKMLVSLPWYGYDAGQAVLGHDVTRRLLQGGGEDDRVSPGSVKVEWDAQTAEQVFGYVSERDGQRHVGTYPTPEFFRRRLQFVKDAGVAGVAIWELGQGLACFSRLF